MPIKFDDEVTPVAQPPAARGRIVFDEPQEPRLEDTIPTPSGPQNPDGTPYAAPPQAAAPERSFMDDVGDFRITPDMDLRSLWTAIKGAPEVIAGGVNNAAAAGVAGLTAPFVSDGSVDDVADFTRDFMEENSHAPQGESAQKLSSALGDAFAPVEHAKRGLGDTIMDATDSPALATAGYMLPDIAATIAGGGSMKGKGPKADLSNVGDFLADSRSRTPPKQKPVNRPDPSDRVGTARAAGYKLLPSQVEQATLKKPGVGDRIAEALAPEDVRRDFVIDNQGVTQDMARQKVKAPKDAPLDEAGLDKLREPHYQAYRDVEKAVEVVPPSEDYLFALDEATQRAKFKKGATPSVTEVISALRTKARKKMNNPNADESIANDGALDRDAADSLEEALGKRLEELGDTESLGKYQDARKSLAELNDVDEAQQGGIVDAGKMHRRDDKNQKRITGETKMVADVAESFPDATKSSLSAAGRKGSTPFPETREGFVKKAAKKTARGVIKGVSKVVPALGDRLLVESEGFQNRIGPKANDAERSYFGEYGKDPELASSPGATNPSKGLDFSEKPGVTPSKAVTLSERLELEPDAVANPQKLPDKPDMLTADTPQRSRGDIEPDFDARLEADKLAGEMGLDVRSGTKGAIGERELSDLLADQGAGDLKVKPREMEQVELRDAETDLPVRGSNKAHLQLTPSPKGAGKITAERDKAGNITVRHEDGGEITAVENTGAGTLQIKDSKVPAESRGQGRGQAMARQLVAMAKKRGLRLVSDNRVSDSAQAMWAALKKKGLNVKQNPATRQASGELVSKSDLKPVFEILDDAVAE